MTSATAAADGTPIASRTVNVRSLPHQHCILLVEDDAAIRGALAGLLAENGVKVWRAKDGRDALRKMRARRKPCLLLLDLMMPGMNGWEFLELHRKERSLASIPLVLVTAWVETEIAQARAMISKPIDAGRLLRTVRTILREEETRRGQPRPARRSARVQQASRNP